MDRLAAIINYRKIAAWMSPHQENGSAVGGIQFRDRPVVDDDLRNLGLLGPELDVVGLEGTLITDEGLRHLRCLPRLDNVDLTNTRISDEGLRILAEIKTLRWVHVEGTRVTANGIEYLQTALPHCEIVSDFQ